MTRTRASLLVLLPLVGAPACDLGDEIGVIELVVLTDAEGVEQPRPSCMLVDRDGNLAIGGGTMGPGFASEAVSMNGAVGYRYYIGPEEDPQAFIGPSNGEFAAEIEADMEFFESGESKHVTFETYDQLTYDVYLWGEPDCEGDLPLEPPPAS